VTDQNDLDGFLASAGIPSGAETVTEPTVSTPSQPEPAPDTSRDELGRFAPKAGDQTPATAEPAQDQTPATTPEPQRTVPLDALTAIRGENRELKQQLQEMARRFSALEQRPVQPQQPPQPAAKPKDFWEDPNAFVAEQLTPIQQQLQASNLRTSKMLAVQAHGRDTVQEAFQALGEALQTTPQARFEYQQIMASDHPYDEMVAWHRKHQAMSRVGTDPDAWLEAEIQKRIADPAFQAKVLETARGSASANGQSQQQPLTSVPPSLSRIPTGGNVVTDADLSSEGLFRHAMAGR